MTVTVSMPTWRTPQNLLHRAVRSVLDQTHEDLRLVVLGDGEPPDLDPADPRMTVHTLEGNRGRYFADAVTLHACSTEWFTCHDADDWSAPERLERLLRKSADVVAGGETVHHRGGRRIVRPTLQAGSRIGHLWHISALYRTNMVRGLFHPGFRVGWDSLLARVLADTCDVSVSRPPTYHRVVRDGSLTQHPDTGFRSQARRDAVERMDTLWLRMRGKTLQEVRDIIADDAGDLFADVEREAAGLRRTMATVDASDVTVTVLTGARPALLAETLSSLRESSPGLLESAQVHVLVNGGDFDTLAVVEGHRDVVDRIDVTATLLPIGPAMSRLAATVGERRFWLHLEDDWRADLAPGWLEDARCALGSVSQVRLRASSEKVLSRHMVTRRPLRWSQSERWSESPDAHLTFNPSLIRAADAKVAWPCTGEQDAQRRWRAAGNRTVAQLVPGVFRHIGVESLRERTGAAV